MHALRNTVLGCTSLSLLLQCLSAYDTAVAVLAVVLFAAPALLRDVAAAEEGGWEAHFMNVVYPKAVVYAYPVLHMAITGSDYLNLAAAVER